MDREAFIHVKSSLPFLPQLVKGMVCDPYGGGVHLPAGVAELYQRVEFQAGGACVDGLGCLLDAIGDGSGGTGGEEDAGGVEEHSVADGAALPVQEAAHGGGVVLRVAASQVVHVPAAKAGVVGAELPAMNFAVAEFPD